MKTPPTADVHEAHRDYTAGEPECRNEDESRGERADERAGGIRSVDQRVNARRVVDTAGEPLGEQRNRRAHQDGRRTDQQRAKADIERERNARSRERNPKRDRLNRSERKGEEQRPDADRCFDRAVDREGTERETAATALDEPAAYAAKERVTHGQTTEEDPEHGGGRFAVTPEQRRKILLPRHLVDEAGKSGQQREDEHQTTGHSRQPPTTHLRQATRRA